MTLSVWTSGVLFTVEAEYRPGRPVTMYKQNGDPGDPPEPDELEIESISIGDQDITDFLTKEQHQAIHDEALVKAGEEYDPDDNRGYDAMDAAKDRRLDE